VIAECSGTVLGGVVVEVTEPERHPSCVFDHAVGGFGAGVGVPGKKEAEDLGPPGITGVCEPGGLGQLGGEDGLVERCRASALL